MSILKEGHHKLPGQLVLELNHPHDKNVFPGVQIEPSMFQFVLIASGPLISLALSLLQNLCGYLDELMRSPWDDLGCTVPALSTSPHMRTVQSLHHPCGLSVDSLLNVPVSLVLRRPDLDTVLQAHIPPVFE